VGWLVQLALIVVDCPSDGAAGFAVGVQTGAPAPPPDGAQVTVCVGGVPEMVMLPQAELL